LPLLPEIKIPFLFSVACPRAADHEDPMTLNFAPRISITIDHRALILTIYLLHQLGFL
jgi:hypothetical protein